MPNDFNKKKKKAENLRGGALCQTIYKQFSTYKFIYKYIANSIHWKYFNYWRWKDKTFGIPVLQK